MLGALSHSAKARLTRSKQTLKMMAAQAKMMKATNRVSNMRFPYCKADKAASAVMVAVEPVSKAKASISINMVYPMLWVIG